MRSPLASGVERLFATRSLRPISSFHRCRSLARLHHRSQQPIAFQLSSICNQPLFDQNSRLRLASEQSCDCPSPTELRVPIDVSKHSPSCEGFNFETQARAIQDISRSRASEFTPLANMRKRNKPHFCDYPVQNLSALWRRVDKNGERLQQHNHWCRKNLETWLTALISVHWTDSTSGSRPAPAFVPYSS